MQSTRSWGIARGSVLLAAALACAGGGNQDPGTGSVPAKLAFVIQPPVVSAGSPFGVTVRVAVQDAAGMTVASATNPVTLSLEPGSGSAGAGLAGTTSSAAVAGLASFPDVHLEKAGTAYRLMASSPGLAGATSAAFDVLPAPPDHLVALVWPSSAVEGATLSPAVQFQVADAYGNPATSATSGVAVAITGGTGAPGALLGGTTSRAASSGIATFGDLTIDRAGPAYTLTATSSGLESATTPPFDVAAGTPAPTGCNNPQPGWIFCDDFEEDRQASYFEFVTDGGRFARVNGVGRDGGYGMRAQFGVGTVSAGSLKLAFGRTPSAYFDPVDAGTRDYREIHWRFYVRLQPGWTGGGGDKLARATVFANANWAQAMIAHVWSGKDAEADYVFIDPASGTDVDGTLVTTKYNDFDNLRWLGRVRSTTAMYAATGQWHCVEAHVRLNSAGQSDGVFELRINGTLEASKSQMNWLGSYSAFGINAVFVENYWNAGSPAVQERYFDDFVVSENPIGCT